MSLYVSILLLQFESNCSRYRGGYATISLIPLPFSMEMKGHLFPLYPGSNKSIIGHMNRLLLAKGNPKT